MLFVHLHTHSAFSFLDGGSSVEDLVARAAELDMPALALTDHDNLCGAVKFQIRALEAGIKPIQGLEATMEGGYHLILLARGPEGYRSLCRLLTRAHLENRRGQPRVSLENLRQNREGLIALSGCRRGEIPSLILSRRYREAREAAARYRDILGKDNFYLEMQDTYLPGNYSLNSRLAELGEELDLEIVASNNVHYARTEDFPVHDILTCVRTLTRVDGVHPERPLNGENYLKQTLSPFFTRYPRAVENTWRIAEQCKPALDLNAPHFPKFELPPGQEAVSLLRELVYQGACERYGRLSNEARERIEHELHIITALGYADYFLVVWDMVNYARSQRIRCAGRGSAADSVVAYCLGITEVDALSRGLLFARFMSLERAEKPDIDIDFDARYRDKVASYIYQKYGADHVASVCTYNTFRARSALRDLGKALGFPEEVIGPLAKRLPHIPADRIRDFIPRLPELRESSLDEKRFELLLDLCEKVAGFPRFLGTHLGGLVVSREPLADITPVQEAAKGVVITQFDKDDVEDLGLIKLDLLSLRTMSAIDDAVISLHRQGQQLDYQRIPLDDPQTYELISSGQTMGIFQLESPAQRALQSRLGASNIEDIVASVALIRPGPIKGNMVEPYIRRRQGKEPVTFLHPDLEPILAKTYGVILFQEQVIEIAVRIAGFTPGEADRLRRVMSHARSHQEMQAIGEMFTSKAVARGVKREVAESIFAQMAGYASYGFCEAHAAAFATTSFKTAYLLCHYPAHFFAAILSNQPMGYYPPYVLLNEARRRGIKILPPDVNISGENYEVEGESIRVPLSVVKGLSRAGLESVLAGRPYKNLADLVLKTRLESQEIENLVRCGAADSLGGNRRCMLGAIPGLLAFRRQKRTGEAALFAGGGVIGDMPDFTEEEKLRQELSLMGIVVRGHLMERLRKRLTAEGYLTSSQVAVVRENSQVKTAGILLNPHRPPTRSGRVTVFLSLEDETGITDVTVFEDVYQQFGHLIFAPRTGILAAQGMVQRRGRAVSLVAGRLWEIGSTPRS